MLQGFSQAAVADIRKRLDLVRQSGVGILFAIESGSRAWGFPSPDSDYDCRFIYVRPVIDHLKLFPERDVIEFPIEGEIDAGGWDLRKALHLALKGNAVVGEWVQSPIAYEEMPGIRMRLGSLLAEIVDPTMVARHYFGLLQRHQQMVSGGEIKLKKLFYALRPALSLRFMEERDFSTLPPMNLQHLLKATQIPASLSDLITIMVDKKSATREMGTGTPPDAITEFLDGSFERYSSILPTLKTASAKSLRDRQAMAERFYIDEITRSQ